MSVKINKSLDDGLVLYLPMNEGSGITVYDKSKYGNNGVISGTPVWEEDEDKGECLLFDGATNKLNCGSDASLHPDNFTVAFWMKLLSHTESFQGVIGTRDTTTTENWSIWTIGAELNSLRLYVAFADIYAYYNTPELIIDTWYHIAMTKSGQTVKYYIDGVLKETYTGVGNYIKNDAKSLFIGSRADGGYYSNIVVDDVYFYNRALSESEISALYRLGVNKSLSDGLVLDAPLNEGSGSTAFDKSKYGNNGTITGATWTEDAEKGECLSFDGVNDKVEVPANSAFDVAEFTIYAEVYVESVSKDFEIFSRAVYNYQRFQWRNSNYRFNLIHTFAGATMTYYSNVMDVADILNKWVSVAVTVSASAVKFYLNGVFNQSFSLVNPADVSSGIAKIGHYDTTFSEGKIRNTRFYNRALSDAEISALYRLTKKGVE